MTWGRKPDGTAVITCDHPGCAQEVTPKHDRTDHTDAADRAVARGWHVPSGEGLGAAGVDALKDFCAEHRPASTLWGLR